MDDNATTEMFVSDVCMKKIISIIFAHILTKLTEIPCVLLFYFSRHITICFGLDVG